MKSTARCYDKLRSYLETVPLIDTHDHTGDVVEEYTDPIAVVCGGYFSHDLMSASSGKEIDFVMDSSKSMDERWPVLEKAWSRSCHTGYARVTKMVLREFYGVEKLTLAALNGMKDQLMNMGDRKLFTKLLNKAKIKARLEDCWADWDKVYDKTYKMSPKGKLVIGIPFFHTVSSHEEIKRPGNSVGMDVTTLDEYVVACREVFERFKSFGAVAFKDQSAYSRTLEYTNPTRAEAEEVFNYLMADPRRTVGHPDGKRKLDDYLFHCFMRMAKEMELPVQIHTGHMAGIWNDIEKTNAVKLRSVLELHKDVRFDLFHANWPYSGELLYLCKNYPNVHIDFCWANIIDPVYCQRMFKQALSSVPHGKIHGYGSDFGGHADRAWAHAAIARDNVAIGLSEMVDMEYLDLDEAKEVGRMWLFDNANAFFKLGIRY